MVFDQISFRTHISSLEGVCEGVRCEGVCVAYLSQCTCVLLN